MSLTWWLALGGMDGSSSLRNIRPIAINQARHGAGLAGAVQAHRFRLIGPNPRNLRSTFRAGSLGGNPIVQNDIPIPFDQAHVTVMAKGVLRLPHLSGQITRINIAQT